MRQEWEGKTHTVDLPPGFKNEGAAFDRFGLMNWMTPGNAMTVYFDDLRHDGKVEDFAQDPGWEGKGNNSTFPDPEQAGAHDFGFSAATNFAGGARGEIGGAFWLADPGYAYYADRIGPLTLEDRLEARGRVVLKVAAPQSDMFLGWFNSASRDLRRSRRAIFWRPFRRAVARRSLLPARVHDGGGDARRTQDRADPRSGQGLRMDADLRSDGQPRRGGDSRDPGQGVGDASVAEGAQGEGSALRSVRPLYFQPQRQLAEDLLRRYEIYGAKVAQAFPPVRQGDGDMVFSTRATRLMWIGMFLAAIAASAVRMPPRRRSRPVRKHRASATPSPLPG